MYSKLSSINYHCFDYKDFYTEQPKMLKNKLFTLGFKEFRRNNIKKYKEIIKSNDLYFASINIQTLVNPLYFGKYDFDDKPIVYLFDSNIEDLRTKTNLFKEEIINDINNLSHDNFLEKYIGRLLK